MVKSMTGFGRAEGKVGKWDLSIEIRAVNSRFLEIVTRAPRGLELIEDHARMRVQERIPRGRISITFSVANGKGLPGTPQLNREVLEAYQSIANEAADMLATTGELDLAQLMALPDVVVYDDLTEESDEVEAQMDILLTKALDQLDQMRAREGKMLATSLTTNLETLETHLAGIESVDAPRLPELVDRLRHKVADLSNESEVQGDAKRMEQEIIFWSDRLDIQEELVRLKAHIEHFRKLMDHSDDVGKRLNFLLQEMNREANTIGSKAYNTDIAHHIVEVKNEIERIREQVQNIQ